MFTSDCISIYHGTALDTSLLINHLGSYVFNEPDAPPIEQHLVMGISLGGHAAWQVLFGDPRVTAGVVVIGCPDYMSKSFTAFFPKDFKGVETCYMSDHPWRTKVSNMYSLIPLLVK